MFDISMALSSLHPSEEGILEEAGAHADDGDGAVELGQKHHDHGLLIH
jgi:hypothetical protein